MSERETKLDRVLRAAAPPRRAPRSLEQRVLREISRRAALPWWHRGYGRWPFAAQACLALVSSLIIAALSSADRPWWTFPPDAVLQLIPATWLYSALGAAAVLYAALFGLGAAAYRVLYLQPRLDDPRA